jgi:hypothetical protein
MIYLQAFTWAGIAQDAPQGAPWWVWIIPAVFLIFLVAGVFVRLQGRGVVRPEKVMIGAASEPKSQPRPHPVTPAAASARPRPESDLTPARPKH